MLILITALQFQGPYVIQSSELSDYLTSVDRLKLVAGIIGMCGVFVFQFRVEDDAQFGESEVSR